MAVQDPTAWASAICLLLGLWLSSAAGMSSPTTWLSHSSGSQPALTQHQEDSCYDEFQGGQFFPEILELLKELALRIRSTFSEARIADNDSSSDLCVKDTQPRHERTQKQFNAPRMCICNLPRLSIF